ncbi:MAG: right-handed parallel beta-helix repeat-containing protein [Leptospirales bacterium]
MNKKLSKNHFPAHKKFYLSRFVYSRFLTTWLILLCTFIYLPIVATEFQTINVGPKDAGRLNDIIKKAPARSKIVFRKGTYHFTKPIRITSKSHLNLQAQEGVYFILDNLHLSVLRIGSSDNIKLSGFHIRHRKPVSKEEYCYGQVITISRSHDLELTNLELNGSGTVGVHIYSGSSITIKDSWFHHNSIAGIWMLSFVDNIVIQNNRFDNNPVHIKTRRSGSHEWKKYATLDGNTFDD